MRLVVQRVTSASVSIDGQAATGIGRGLVVLAGICAADTEKIAAQMVEKLINLRIFADDNGDMNLSLLDTQGECLTVSNFTLYANCRKGRRPSFINAAPPSHSEPLYAHFVKTLEQSAAAKVVNGKFGADMLVDIQNDGPVTIILDSDECLAK